MPDRITATNYIAKFALAAIFIFPGAKLNAQQLSLADAARLDSAIQQVVVSTRVPSVSAGVAHGGRVVYARAFGQAVLPRNVGVATTQEGKLALSQATTKPIVADAAMAYPIGSISKQFTAACILLLQERGKLRLDDPVSKWFPNFTRADEVTLRNLLTHTSGYSDYAPQDYTIPAWTQATDPTRLVTEWATKPLDFDPGTRWQYSNTNFEIAALIIEKTTGQRFHEFLWQNIIVPLKLQGVLDLDTQRNQLIPRGYEQHALGPIRPAILEAPGWYYGDAQLAMPIATLLAWDESIVHRTLLQPASYEAMETDFKLKDGKNSGYGLGVFVRKLPSGKKIIYHSGEVGGFVSNNVVALDDDIAFAALTNEEARVASLVTRAMTPILLPETATAPTSPVTISAAKLSSHATGAAESQAQAIVTSFQEGDFDPNLFTADANFYFNEETIADYSQSLAALGELRDVRQTDEELRGGMVYRAFDLDFAKQKLSLTTYTLPGGRLEQFIVGPAS